MKRYVTQTVLFLSYAIFAAAWVSGSIITPSIQGEFAQQGLANASWGANMITIAKIIGNLGAAWLLVQLGAKRAAFVAMVLVALGGLGSLAGAYDQWLFSRLVLGFGGALIIVYFNPYVVHYFAPEERPLVNGINAAAFNVGNLLALLTTGALVSVSDSWRSVVQVYFWIPTLLALIWLLFTDEIDTGGSGTNTDKAYSLSEGIKEGVNWILPLAYCGILFFYISIFAVFPLLDGFAVPSAHLSAVLIASGILGTIAGILAARRFTMRLPIIKICGALVTLSGVVMIMSTSVYVSYTAAMLAGFFMFTPMTALVTLPQELPNMTPSRITVIFGMFWSISYAVETLVMWGASTVADYYSEPLILAWSAVIGSSTLFLFAFLLPETGKKES